MKRKMSLFAGAAALGLVVYLGSRLWAQTGAQPVQPPAQTRIAMVNFIHVLQNYHKFKTYQVELTEKIKPYKDFEAERQKNLDAWQKALKEAKSTEQREKAEMEIKNRKRELEDNAQRAQKLIKKCQEEQIVQLYKEIEEAVKRYAGSNGFNLVMQFSEPPNPSDYHDIRNIGRKLEAWSMGMSSPIYMAPGMDITAAVLSNLNAGVPAAQGPANGPAPAGGFSGQAAPAGR